MAPTTPVKSKKSATTAASATTTATSATSEVDQLLSLRLENSELKAKVEELERRAIESETKFLEERVLLCKAQRELLEAAKRKEVIEGLRSDIQKERASSRELSNMQKACFEKQISSVEVSLEVEKKRAQAAEEKVVELEQRSVEHLKEVSALSKKLELQNWKNKESLAENALLKQQLEAAKRDEAAWVKRCEVMVVKNDELRQEARSNKEINDRKHESKIANRQGRIDEDFKGRKADDDEEQ